MSSLISPYFFVYLWISKKMKVMFVHQNLISNRLTYLVHTKSTGELISFGFSDHSVRSLVSAKRSANRWDQTKNLHFLADLWSQSEFRTEQNAERKTNPKSEMTQTICSLFYRHPTTELCYVSNVYCYDCVTLTQTILVSCQHRSHITRISQHCTQNMQLTLGT